VLGTLGGPIVRDKVFFYTGYEWVKKDLSATRDHGDARDGAGPGLVA